MNIKVRTNRDVTRQERGGGIPGVCAATAEESLHCEELRFLSAAVRGKNTDQTIVVWINVLPTTVQILVFAAAVLSVSTYIMGMCRKVHWQDADGFDYGDRHGTTLKFQSLVLKLRNEWGRGPAQPSYITTQTALQLERLLFLMPSKLRQSDFLYHIITRNTLFFFFTLGVPFISH